MQMKGIHNSCGLCSIEMQNISVISGEDTLLDNVNLTFHCGELTALIGKNGQISLPGIEKIA